jgi:hypothetical protein
MFVTTSFVTNVIIRDDETRFGAMMRSTPITLRDISYVNLSFGCAV